MHDIGTTVCIAALTAILGGACGGHGGGGGPTPPAGDSPFTRPANPLRVAVALDRTRAAKAVIPTAGGTIRATGADGARFTLTIPADALLVDTEITLVPVTSIAGHTLRGAAAVQLEPDGLRLFQPARLRFEPAQAIAVGDQVSAGWHGQGEDIHLEPLDFKTTDLVMPLWHFSGAEVGPILIGDNQPLPVDPTKLSPKEVEDIANQALRQLFQAERARLARGEQPNPLLLADARAIYAEWFKYGIEPQLGRIASDCEVAKAASPKVVAFARGAALFGASEYSELGGAIFSAVHGGLANCFAREKERCRAADDRKRWSEIVQIVRQLQLLFNEAVKPEDVPVCKATGWTGTFTARSHSSTLGGTSDETVTANVTFTLAQSSATERDYTATGEVHYSASFTGGTCSRVYSGTGAIQPRDGYLRVFTGSPPMYLGGGLSNPEVTETITCGSTSQQVKAVVEAAWFRMTQPMPQADPSRIAGEFRSSGGMGTTVWTWDLTPLR